MIKAAIRCAASFLDPPWMDKVNFRIVPDTAVTKQHFTKNNLVLFGNVRTNKILAEISDKLPLQMNRNCIVAKRLEFSGENIGYVLIYPNPLNREKYIAVFSGNTADAIDCFDRIWPHLNSIPKNIDVGIFELAERSNSIQWKLKEVFGTDWDWPSGDSRSLSE